MPALRTRRLLITLLAASALICATNPLRAATWAERLGYSAGSRVVILGMANMGWCYESNAANAAIIEQSGMPLSASVMPPAPWFSDAAVWRRAHPEAEVGLSFTLLSEGDAYRFGPTAPRGKLKALVDADGYLPDSLRRLEINGSPQEVEIELRAQLDRCLRAGIRPTHLMTQKGALLSRTDLAEVYLRLAQEYWIPAVIVELTPAMLDEFQRIGLPMEADMIELIAKYPLPKLDELRIAPDGDSYDAKKAALLQEIAQLPPGLTEIFFRPADDSPALHRLTPHWQQQAWDRELLLDPEVRQAFSDGGIILTNWREVMQRFEGTLTPTEAIEEAEQALDINLPAVESPRDAAQSTR